MLCIKKADANFCKCEVVKTVERKRKGKKKKVMRMCAISLGKTEG